MAKARENLNFAKILFHTFVRPHRSASDSTLVYVENDIAVRNSTIILQINWFKTENMSMNIIAKNDKLQLQFACYILTFILKVDI